VFPFRVGECAALSPGDPLGMIVLANMLDRRGDLGGTLEFQLVDERVHGGHAVARVEHGGLETGDAVHLTHAGVEHHELGVELGVELGHELGVELGHLDLEVAAGQHGRHGPMIARGPSQLTSMTAQREPVPPVPDRLAAAFIP
jgi:hypothetical protein